MGIPFATTYDTGLSLKTYVKKEIYCAMQCHVIRQSRYTIAIPEHQTNATSMKLDEARESIQLYFLDYAMKLISKE